MLFLKRLTGLLQISLEPSGKALLDLGMLRLDTSVSQWTKPAVTAGSAQLLSATAGAKSPMRCRKLHAFIDAKEVITGTNWFLFCFYNLNLTYWELWRPRSSFWTQYHIPWEKSKWEEQHCSFSRSHFGFLCWWCRWKYIDEKSLFFSLALFNLHEWGWFLFSFFRFFCRQCFHFAEVSMCEWYHLYIQLHHQISLGYWTKTTWHFSNR